MRPADTSPEAWRVLLDLQRRLSPSDGLRRAFEYSEFVRKLAEGVLRQQPPDATDREIFLREARQRLGADLFRKAFGQELPDDGSAARLNAIARPADRQVRKQASSV
jgi:hypothetical protein